MIADLIRFSMSNFPLTFLLLGFVAAAIAIWRAPRPRTAPIVVEHLTAAFMLWSVVFTNLYNAVFHIFFGDYAAAFIGWAQSPFQAEVGFASLGFAALGVLAFRGSWDYRVAAVVAPACFTIGDVFGHLYQQRLTGDMAAGNSGLFVLMAGVIPAVGATLVWLQHRYGQPARGDGRAPTTRRGSVA